MAKPLQGIVLRSLVVIALGGFSADLGLFTQFAAAQPPMATTIDEGDASPPPPVKRPNEKKVKAYAGLFALGGIVIVGLFLLALTVLWASRLRRQLRRPLPDNDPPERDFWFLKPPKKTIEKSSLPEFDATEPQPPNES